MNAQDFRSLQEAYMEVIMNEGFKKLPWERMERKKDQIYKKYMKSKVDSPEEQKLLRRDKKISDVLNAPRPKPKTQKEQIDLYDIILSHLLDEGYVETPEAAEAIMVNMSEYWRESICEAEIEPPKEKVGALTNIDIPMSEREAARQRTLAKAKAMREKKKIK